MQEGGIKVLGELLKQSSMVMMALEGLERILQVREIERVDSGPFFFLPYPGHSSLVALGLFLFVPFMFQFFFFFVNCFFLAA